MSKVDNKLNRLFDIAEQLPEKKSLHQHIYHQWM